MVRVRVTVLGEGVGLGEFVESEIGTAVELHSWEPMGYRVREAVSARVGESWEVVALDWGFVQYHRIGNLGCSLGD
jgi:hypothetical protein